MSGAKEIRDKIKSIQSTQKTTRAMEMVAASKMRKAQLRMQASRPYAHKMRKVITHHVALSSPEYHHSYFYERDIKRVGYIIVSTDRGLCGGLNMNLFRKVIDKLLSWQRQDVAVDLCLIGRKAEGFFQQVAGTNVVAQANHLGDKPTLPDLIGIVKVMLQAYDEGRIDRLFVASNEFVNTMSQKPKIAQLIPLEKSGDEALQYHWDYIYEPDAKEVLDQLMTRYVESQVYQAVIENGACQQAATMVAMKSASDNAGDLIGDLQRVYNKARQASITQEISEIVSGAAAVE